MKQKILGLVEDLVSDFLYYDRKDDEYVKKGEIDKAIKAGEITIEEIVEQFSNKLKKGLRN